MYFRKIIYVLLAGTGMVGLLFACSGPNTSESQNKSDSAAYIDSVYTVEKARHDSVVQKVISDSINQLVDQKEKKK